MGRRGHRIATGAVGLLLVTGGTTQAAGAAGDVAVTAVPASPTVTRLAGPDRYATAVAIARASFPLTPERAVDVVVARGDAFPDALSAVNITGADYGGPAALLLTRRDSLSAESLDVIADSGFTHANVLGTPDVVSIDVFDRVKAVSRRSGVVYRGGGLDRYGTNRFTYHAAYNEEADIPRSVDGQPTAFLVSGTSFADAISVGPVSSAERIPLLLTDPTSLSPSVRDILGWYRLGITQVVVVGGSEAVSEQVVDQLRALGMTVRRIAGGNRQATSVAVYDFAHEEFGWGSQHVTLTRGDGFADALAGASYSGRRQSAIMLTAGPDVLGGPAREFLRAHAGDVEEITVLGDDTAVSNTVVAEAVTAAG